MEIFIYKHILLKKDFHFGLTINIPWLQPSTETLEVRPSIAALGIIYLKEVLNEASEH